MGSSTIGGSSGSALTGPSTSAYTGVATSANTYYEAAVNFPAGTYTITCTSTVTSNVDFWNGSTFIGTATTVSGTVAYNLATAANKIAFWTSSGTSVNVNFALSGQTVSSSFSGTIDTLTNSGTYNVTGTVYVVVVGGGGGGSGGQANNQGFGGGSGGVTG